MTAAQSEQQGMTEAEAVLRWRFDVLVGAGYDPGSAIIVASQVDVDLHLASTLVRRGCTPELAMRIVL